MNAMVQWGCIGLDLGGSLAKMAFLEVQNEEHRTSANVCTMNKQDVLEFLDRVDGSLDKHLAYFDPHLSGRVHFVRWPCENMSSAVGFLKRTGLHEEVRRIVSAGGGAHKYAQLFDDELGIELLPSDELAVIIHAVSWLTERLENEVYELTYEAPASVTPLAASTAADEPPSPKSSLIPTSRCYLNPTSLFPFLLVNIGTGVSIVKVSAYGEFERVGGTAMGGGAYWGLTQLLSDCESWEEAMEQAAQGDANDVNLLVQDIYGGDYVMPSGSVLPGHLTASFFGKVRRSRQSDKNSLLAALTRMISQTICQVVYLNARIHNTDRVIFTGQYLRLNAIARHTIAQGFRMANTANSGGQHMRAFFLAHEGYFGALGSLLQCHTAAAEKSSVTAKRKRLRTEEVSWQFMDASHGVHVLEVDTMNLFPSVGRFMADSKSRAANREEFDVVDPTRRKLEDAVIFRASCASAVQTFASALVQTEVPALLMELFGNNPKHYAAFASRQASLERVLDLFLVSSACTLSDRVGRKPLRYVSGGIIGVAWNVLCLSLADPTTEAWRILLPKPLLVITVSALKALHSAFANVLLAMNSSAISDACHGDPERMTAAIASGQSFVGLAIILAPLVAIQLRRLHRRAPFAACAMLLLVNWLHACKLPETLGKADRNDRIAWSEALNPLASATLLLRQSGSARLQMLCVAFSLASITRCADTVLQAFTRKSMRWGNNESARLLSFWGLTVFLGNQTLRKSLTRLGPNAAVSVGAIFLSAQELLKSLANEWWHLPAALVFGLPSVGLEPALKALIAKEARRSTALRGGAIQAALKTQQVLTMAVTGPLIGAAFARWASQAATPRFAWHYVVCSAMAMASGVVHAVYKVH